MEKRELSLIDILQLLKVRWWIVLLAAIVVAGGAGIFSYVTYVPMYSSDLSVHVNDQTAGMQNSSVSDDVSQVNWALKVIKNYIELLKADDFMEEISTAYKEKYPEAWKKQAYTVARLSKCIQYEAEEDTYIFKVTITTKDKEASLNLGKIFEELAPKRIENITGRDNAISIADSARPDPAPANSRNMVRNAVIGFLVGAILSFVVVLIIDIIDVRIKDEDDIIDKYPFPLLGSVPNFESAKKKGYGYGKK